MPAHVWKIAVATATIIILVLWAAASGPTPGDSGASQAKGAVTPMGTLTLDTEPTTDVYFGDTRLGTTPLTDVPLPVGIHRLRVRNPSANVDQEVEVQIKHNQLTSQRSRL